MLDPLREKNIFAKSQISKHNTSQSIPQGGQPPKKFSLNPKQTSYQTGQINKENTINESWTPHPNKENANSGKGLRLQPKNSSLQSHAAKPPMLRIINSNLPPKNFIIPADNWSLSVDSNTSSSKSPYLIKLDNTQQEESLDIGTPELLRNCSSPFFSDNTPTFSVKSGNDSFGAVSKRNTMEMPGHDTKRLKRDCQLSPRTKSYFEDLERRKKEVNTKDSVTDTLTFYLGLLPEIQSKYHWKLFLELAEACKKECSYKYAKFFYKAAISLQPYNPEV